MNDGRTLEQLEERLMDGRIRDALAQALAAHDARTLQRALIGTGEVWVALDQARRLRGRLLRRIRHEAQIERAERALAQALHGTWRPDAEPVSGCRSVGADDAVPTMAMPKWIA